MKFSGVQVELSLSTTKQHQVVLRFKGELPDGYDRVWIRVYAQKQESVYGCGQQYTYLNLRGRSYPIWTREQGRNHSANSSRIRERAWAWAWA